MTKHAQRASTRRRRPLPPADPGGGATATIPALAILPLRLFLGATFVYAGFQKIADPGFFQAGSRTYIGTQIAQFSQGSPVSFLLHAMGNVAVIVGLLTIITEVIVGVLVLFGLFTRPAAIVGLLLNMGLFLSASWHTYPYFLGADIVFVICWLTLALTGPGPFALDSLAQLPMSGAFITRFGATTGPVVHDVVRGPLPRPATSGGPEPLSGNSHMLTRAEALVGVVGAAVLVFLGLAPRGGTSGQTSLKNLGGAASAGPTPRPTAAPAAGSTPAPTAAPAPPAAAGIPAGAKKIGNVSQLPVNTGGTVSDPKSGDPAIIVHTTGNNFYAYDAVCTHAGCTVEYDPQQKLLVCPCHGGTFDPAHGAQVVAGPPPSPLAPLEMKIDPQGNIYLV